MLVIFDLNGFKHYNDSFGHPAGDALLARLGARQRDGVRRPRPRLPDRRRRVLRLRAALPAKGRATADRAARAR